MTNSPGSVLRIVSNYGVSRLEFWVNNELYKSASPSDIPAASEHVDLSREAFEILYFLTKVCERMPGELFRIEYEIDGEIQPYTPSETPPS